MGSMLRIFSPLLLPPKHKKKRGPFFPSPPGIGTDGDILFFSFSLCFLSFFRSSKGKSSLSFQGAVNFSSPSFGYGGGTTLLFLPFCDAETLCPLSPRSRFFGYSVFSPPRRGTSSLFVPHQALWPFYKNPSFSLSPLD